jgi:hypothetical protein
VAGKTGEGVELASVRLFGVGLANHCGAGTKGEGAVLTSFSLVDVGLVRGCVHES